MNGKFESNSNDYDESNLNRLHSVPDAGVVAGDLIARNEFRMDASLRAAFSERNDRASFNRFSRSDLIRPAPGMRIGGSFVCEPRALHPDNGSPVGQVDLHSASRLQKFGPKNRCAQTAI
jgi:hypothetical protein